MNATSVFKKDILDVRRAKIVWFVAVVYSLLIGLFFYQTYEFSNDPDSIDALVQLIGTGGVFIPAIALVTAYLAIAGERESGSLKFLLSTPIRRRDVVVGKFLSRGAVVGASVLLAFVVGGVLSVVLYGGLDTGALAVIGLLTVLYALAYMSVALAVSAVTASRSRAMGGALGFFFLTTVTVFIPQISIAGIVEYVANDLLGAGVGDDPITLIAMLTSPTMAYFQSTNLGLPDEHQFDPGEFAAYAGPEAATVLLLAWIVVPLAFGIWRFDRADLG